MRQNYQLRRIAKRIGISCCCLIALVTTLSCWWAATFSFDWGTNPTTARRVGLGVAQGGVVFWSHDLSLSAQIRSGWDFYPLSMRSNTNKLDFLFLPQHVSTSTGYFVTSPLWVAFVIALVPTVFLWRGGSRPIEGHCVKCDYDLTGNTSGVCSECGTKIDAGQRTTPATGEK